MNDFRFVLKPLTFNISAHSNDPIKALEEILKCGTEKEELLLSYLAREIEDHPSLTESVFEIPEGLGSFCHLPVTGPINKNLRAPIFYPIPVGPGSRSGWNLGDQCDLFNL